MLLHIGNYWIVNIAPGVRPSLQRYSSQLNQHEAGNCASDNQPPCWTVPDYIIHPDCRKREKYREQLNKVMR